MGYYLLCWMDGILAKMLLNRIDTILGNMISILGTMLGNMLGNMLSSILAG